MKSSKPDTNFVHRTKVINCGGQLLDLSKPGVMGILNITPDSFYDGGKFTEQKLIIKHAGKMLREGASILDIGAQSTRPGATKISVKTELKRAVSAIKSIKNAYPEAIISIDTFHSEVASEAVHAGASIINDISGGTFDKNMFKTAGKLKVPYILMHIKGTPATMQNNPVYKDVVEEIFNFMKTKIQQLEKKGVTDIIIDPGFGFGKNVEHNYSLLKHLKTFTAFNYPILAGISRKSMICKVLNLNPEKALNGTTALNMLALQNGASILRVHDVKEAVETIKLFDAYQNCP